MKQDSVLAIKIVLACVIAAGCFLRFYHLSFQSFWLDELHTVNETAPGMSWTALVSYLKCCDQHPPLFFAVEKISFLLFGSNEFTARAVSALASSFSIWAIYLLGKEFYSARLGLVAAILLSVNFFHIEYAQEARPYAFLFLFSTFSFLYLLRLIKSPSLRNSIGYAVFTVLMLASHYFGLFALISQLVIIIFAWATEKEKRKVLVKKSLLSGLIIVVACAAWIPILLAIGGIRSFWLQEVSPGFAIDFFYEYFGNSDLLKPLLLLFIISAVYYLLRENEAGLSKTTFRFAFLFCFLWIAITYFIPYLRSLLLVPSLHPRYTILVLPAYIILLSFGVELISSNILKYTLLAFFCVLSLTDLFFVKKYYASVSKTQFRELAAFISKQTFTLPVLSEKTAWHQGYYFRQNNYPYPVLDARNDFLMDSVLSEKKIPGFWIVDGHNAEKPSGSLNKKLNGYSIALEKEFYDAWAQLYIKKDSASSFRLIDHTSFPGSQHFKMEQDTVVAIWEKLAVSDPLRLKKGNYMILLNAKGQPASGEYPNVSVYLGDKLTGIFNLKEHFDEYPGYINLNEDSEMQIKIVMNNDLVDAKTNEDRNAFIRSLLLVRIGQKF
jgi:uncharacterized membrane protein